jgi:aminoglycoside phosphotransferase (APT) family kinase protein
MPARYEDLVRGELPLSGEEIARLRDFAPGFARLCTELAAHAVPESVQHDDLHMNNLFQRLGHLRILDWGDSSISHPFASLVVTFRFLEETNGLSPDDPWFDRLRDAYLEPWGAGLKETFMLAMRVGAFAHAIGWARQRDYLPEDARQPFDLAFATVLRRALVQL